MANGDPVEALYGGLLRCWNERDADGFADLFRHDGTLVGFDGSCIEGAAAIAEHLGAIFGDHEPARYVARTREVRPLGPSTALLRAVAGMVPPGADDLRPELNTVHLLVAAREADGWQVAHLQATPARFDGRPEEARALTEELRTLVPSRT
jgi:uncharacterized protein (TIGR02246 family)